MNGWDIKEFFDEVIFEFYNLYNFIHSIKYKNKIRRIDLDLDMGGECSLILNGPSSADCKINDSDVYFVNYGFKHKCFSKVEKPILIIVDTQLTKDKWDYSMMDEAIKINPSVRFIFNYKYLSSKKFKASVKDINCIGYINNSRIPTRFNWQKKLVMGSFNFGVGVAEQSLSLLASLNYKKIKVYGFDGNNVLLGLMNKDTHFYGVDESKKWYDSQFTARELRFLSYFIDRNYWLSKCMDYNNVKVINHSDSLITSMYDKDKFKSF